MSEPVSVHIHLYVYRVPGLEARSTKGYHLHPEFNTWRGPAQIVRNNLLRPVSWITETFGKPDEALKWHHRWMRDNPRLETAWGADGEDSGIDHKARFTREELWRRSNVVDGFYTPGGEYKAAVFIPCPSRAILGFPEPPKCPLRRG